MKTSTHLRNICFHFPENSLLFFFKNYCWLPKIVTSTQETLNLLQRSHKGHVKKSLNFV